MQKFTLLTVLTFLVTTIHAQVQFVTTAFKRSGTSQANIFSFKPDGSSALVHDFNVSDATGCNGVVVGPGGRLYGATLQGGADFGGTLFSVNQDGTDFKVIYHFKNDVFQAPPFVGPDGKLYVIKTDGLYYITADGSTLIFLSKVPRFSSRLVFGEDQWMYGSGSGDSQGIIYRIKTDGTEFTILHEFDFFKDGTIDVQFGWPCITPTGRIFLISKGVNGTCLVSMRTDGSDFKIETTFAEADQLIYGNSPLTRGALVHHNGKIIFMMYSGGQNNNGTLVSFDTLTSKLANIFTFPSTTATRDGNESANPVVANDKLVGINCDGLYSVSFDGTGYKQLNKIPLKGYSLLNYDPFTNGIYYAANGGAFKNTQLVKVNAVTSAVSTIHSFGNVPQGYNPDGITRAPNGILYGIARNGGKEGGGTIFRMNANGAGFGLIRDFTGDNGYAPTGKLLYASDGRLYGVCKKNGLPGKSDSMLIYGMDGNGNNYVVLHSFDLKSNGIVIPELAEGSSGKIAGIVGGDDYQGIARIFKINKDGTGFEILKTFPSDGSVGLFPKFGLVYFNNFFYGVTTFVGNSPGASGSIFAVSEYGGSLTVIKYFGGGDLIGTQPATGLTLGSDNRLYGATGSGGVNNNGTVFVLDPSSLNVNPIYSFTFNDGFAGMCNITEASNGMMYMTRYGGIFQIKKDGSNGKLIQTTDYNPLQSSGLVSYLTEIPLPVETELCAPLAGTMLKSDIIGTNYQWQLNTGNGFVDIADNVTYAGTKSNALTLNTVPSSWTGYQYRCIADGGESKIYTLKFVDNWTGATDNSWENAANWSCGSLPDENTDVIINSGTIAINSNVVVRSLKLNPSVQVNVASGANITILH